jgi:hypothetical protein
MKTNDFFYRLTHWESWHYLAKYIPIAPVWCWYCLKARSFWFFTPSNPTLTFGGFEGEGKKEMYDQLPKGSFPETVFIDHTLTDDQLEKVVCTHKFQYPFIVKPDVGMMGLMFRRINKREELLQYHHKMPADYFLQELVTYPLEVSVFYYRYPDQQKGTITGFLKKEFLEVVGNGKSTLWQLILEYPRVRFRLSEMAAKHSDNLQQIIPAGEKYCLSYALNLSRGGRMVSLEQEKDERLLQVFDQLSHYSKYFYYGRYDIKCASVEDLKAGKNFKILEYNGCGAEPHHIYGNGYTLFEAYRIVMQHWKVLYEISKFNHDRGHQYWSFRRGQKFLKKARQHFRMLKKLDAETPL